MQLLLDGDPVPRRGLHSRLTSHPPGIGSCEELFAKTRRASVKVTRRWTTSLDGSTFTVSEIGFADDEADIRARVDRRSVEEGWTPKRWWQFWRWDDTPNPEPRP